MLHGAFCGGWAFDHFRAPFEADGYEVVTPTLRHHDMVPRGRPPMGLGTTGLADFIEDLEKDVAHIDRPVLLGHSMGGLLAQMLAPRVNARALVLIAPSAPWGVLPSGYGEIASAFGLYLAGDFWSQPLRPRYAVAAQHALDRLSSADRSAVFSRFVHESGQAMFEILHWGLDLSRASFVYANDVRCPVLALAGGHDQVNPAGTVRRVAMRYRQRARFLEFPEMSHWLIGEPGWDDVAGIALDFLAEL